MSTIPNIGIYFGTDTGRTRRIAKLIAQKLGDMHGLMTTAPLNINRVTLEDFLAHELLILGCPTYGDGELPGLSCGLANESWEEFLPKLAGSDMQGKKVALFGLGEQEKYPDEFVDALIFIHDAVVDCGASIVGTWPLEGYSFKASAAVLDNRFVGLPLDQISQAALTDARVDTWLHQVVLEANLQRSAA